MNIRLLLCLLLCATLVASNERTHKYKEGEPITLWANKVGPYRNPQETYEYYSLPFCKPAKIEDQSESLGEALSGYELVKSKIEISFRTPERNRVLCTVSGLSKVEIDEFLFAVQNQYWFEFFLDELPVWGLVGDVHKDGKKKQSEKEPFVYTHTNFVIKYNGDRVIEISLTQDNPLPLSRADKPFKWTYSVEWEETKEKFEHRFDRYLDNHFFEHQIHWFSIFNSFMMVILLVGLVAIILMRTLKKDITRFTQNLEEENELDESGWKQVHGDVFRAPAYLDVFAALYGTGAQLLVLSFFTILLAIGFYHNHPFYRRGTLVTVCVVLFSLTGIVGGYFSGNFYVQSGGKNWKKSLLYTITIFPGGVMGTAFMLNFIAVAYDSLAHIPLSTMIIVFLLYLFVYCPVTLGGTILGRNFHEKVTPPCRIHPLPRAIPEKRAYQQLWVQILAGGILPFGSIFIEMYFVLTAFWQYKYYYVFGFLLLVYLILVIVTCCSTIVSCYFLLNSEDYRWQWVSFLSGFSTSIYVYIYATYYFFTKTKMSGFFQVTFYFGYQAMFCFGLGLLCGAVGFIGANFFVHRIYRMIHVD